MKIKHHIGNIVEMVKLNQVSQVEADTGSGKSIAIPGAVSLDLDCIVFVSVPRITSAKTLSQYAGKFYPQLTFGVGAEGKVEYDYRTRVVYGTDGHIRRKILTYVKNGIYTDIDFCSVLFIDEVHIGSVNNDAIMSHLMGAKNQGKNIPKVCFLSATPVETFFEPSPVIYHVDIGHPYPVELIYHSTDFPSSDYDKIYEETVKVVSKIPEEDGDILVFVHGKKPAEDMAALISKLNPLDLVLTAYSGMKSEDFDLIYKRSEKRKIIIATNVVEASITIDGLGVVVDTLLENYASTSSTGGLRLTVNRISKDSAKQRLGRTGRTRRGKCIRMISAVNYEYLEPHIIPEIQRVPINELVMEFISAGLDPVFSIRGVKVGKIKDSIELLTELGAIEDGKVTDLGHFLPSVPLGVRNGAFLYHWVKEEYPVFPGMVVAAILDGYQSPGYFYIPRRGAKEEILEYSQRLNDFFEDVIKPFFGRTQLHTFLNLWDSFARVMNGELINIIKYGDFNAYQWTLFRPWAEKHSVNQKKFRELILILRQIYNNVSRINSTANKNIGFFNPFNVGDKALSLIGLSYSGQLLVKNFGDIYFHKKMNVRHVLGTMHVFSDMESGDTPNLIYAISTVQTGKNILVSLALPCMSNTEKDEE